MVEGLYGVLDAMVEAQDAAQQQMVRLGKRYPEIQEFLKMPGVGPVGAHVFDAYIQTPHRFATKQKLWRYCKLGIVKRSSNGKPLAYHRLDHAGNGELKAMSYRAWLSAFRTSKPNEVTRFYEQSLDRTQNATHARLNTQRNMRRASGAPRPRFSAFRMPRSYRASGNTGCLGPYSSPGPKPGM